MSIVGSGRKDAIERAADKPATLPVHPLAIPADLRNRPQWVCWGWVRREGRWTKPPINPATGRMAKANDPRTWAAYDDALAMYGAGKASGVGFVFDADDPFAGIDLDDARDPESGELELWALEILGALDSYTEVSPSGTGVKVIVKAKLPAGASNRKGNVEIYDRGRYFTVTGVHVSSTPDAIQPRQQQLDALLARLFPPTPKPAPTNGQHHGNSRALPNDAKLIERAMKAKNGDKFRRLWTGDTSGHGGDDSAADLALCDLLAFWTGPDGASIDRLFRQSGLYRQKWERQDYREATIHKALTARTDFYRPFHQNGVGKPQESFEAIDDPHRLARIAIDQQFRHTEGLILRAYRGEFIRWDGSGYRAVPTDEIRATLTALAKAEFDNQSRRVAAEERKAARRVTKHLITDVENAFRSMTILPAATEAPAWLEGPNPFAADEILLASNGLVHLPSFVAGKPGYFHQPTPRLLSFNALDYRFDPDAGEPVQWLRFLAELFPDDQQAIETLRDWFGYCLTPDTRLQKILLVVGPARSGKGTITRVLRRLVGPRNVCGPTLASLETNFGLSPLLDKTVATISDARLSGRTDQAKVVERLLSISGEDAVTIDRKHLPPVTVKLNARFLILSNELPRFADSSGALVSRLVILHLTRSWLGSEDVHLTDKLLTELPAILLWSIRGWDRVRVRRKFVQPQSSLELLSEMDDLSSPVGAFVRECCLVGPGYQIPIKELFAQWKRWTEEKGRDHAGDEAIFGRNLRAAVPSIKTTQQRQTEARIRVYEGITYKHG